MFKLKTLIILIIISLVVGCSTAPIAETMEVKELDNPVESIKPDFKLTNNEFSNDEFKLKINEIDKNFTEEFMTKKEENKVVRIKYTIENLSKSDMLIDSFNGVVNKKMVDMYFGGTDQAIAETVLSGTSKDASCYFEVPKDATEMQLIYDYGVFVDKKIKFKISLK